MPYGVKKQGDKWVKYKKDTGKIVSHHDSKEKAEASIRAYYMNKKSSVMSMSAFFDGFNKVAKENPIEPVSTGERAVAMTLGSPLHRAIYAPKGHKLPEFGRGYVRNLVGGVAGGLSGAALGAAAGRIFKPRPLASLYPLIGAHLGAVAGAVGAGHGSPEAMRKSVAARKEKRSKK